MKNFKWKDLSPDAKDAILNLIVFVLSIGLLLILKKYLYAPN